MARRRATLAPEIIAAIQAYPPNTSQVTIAKELGLSQSTVSKYRNNPDFQSGAPADSFQEDTDKGEATLQMKTSKLVKTLADAIEVAEIDQSVWEIVEWKCKQWTTPMKVGGGQKMTEMEEQFHVDGKLKKLKKHQLQWQPLVPVQQQQYLVSVRLRRKTPEATSLERILEEIAKKKGITLPVYKYPAKKKCRRALEISLMDPHLGLRCFAPQADIGWSLEEAEQAFMATAERLLEQAQLYGPFEEVIAPIGNDYFHADSIWHTTTAGTPQPEMESLHEVYVHAQKLILWFTERLRSIAPVVKLFSIPGNHDRFVSFTMARLVQAFYAGMECKSVDVDASPSPYKFWAYGVNLIGFEHGHSVKPIRLAALMANETRLNLWQNARYCEWHLGDQHRKGSSNPSMHEEQGVSVEYLPSLTPPNEWHRLKSFNWQKRGAFGFIYDRDAGPVARIQVNFDSHTGLIMGERAEQKNKGS